MQDEFKNTLNNTNYLSLYSRLYPNGIMIQDNKIMFVGCPRYYDRLQPINLCMNLKDKIKALDYLDVENYFNFFSTKTIDYLQNISIDNSYYNEYKIVCDYCGFCLKDNKNFYFCKLCATYMCELCYEEKRSFTFRDMSIDEWEDINKSKESVRRCKNHLYFTKLVISDLLELELECNMCRSRFSVMVSESIYCNREKDYDTCDKCYNEFIRIQSKKLPNKPSLLQQLYLEFFGSFLDWIPILSDNNNSVFILLNLNPYAILFDRVAIYYQEDDFYKMIVLHYSLDKLLDQLQEIELIEENNIIDEFLIKYMDNLLTNCQE